MGFHFPIHSKIMVWMRLPGALSQVAHRNHLNKPLKSWTYNTITDEIKETHYRLDPMDGFFKYYFVVNSANGHIFQVRGAETDESNIKLNKIVELKPDGKSGIQYTHPANIILIRVSDDGRKLLIFDRDDRLYTMDTTSGQIQELPSPGENKALPITGFIGNKIYYYFMKARNDNENGIYRFDIASGEKEWLTDGSPSMDVSNDGKYIVYCKGAMKNKDTANEARETHVYLYSLVSNEIEKTILLNNKSLHPLFRPGGLDFSVIGFFGSCHL